MEQKSWIRRIRSKEDERKVWIELTTEGEALKEKAVNIPKIWESVSILMPKKRSNYT